MSFITAIFGYCSDWNGSCHEDGHGLPGCSITIHPGMQIPDFAVDEYWRITAVRNL
jgi:hypothetical protein